MGFNLPHKANVGEIIRVKGYEGVLYLVMEWTEEIEHGADGTIEETVSYTCRNIDNHKEIKIIFDQDIASIVVTADKSDEFIKNRLKGAGPPAIQPPQQLPPGGFDLAAFARQFAEEKRRREQQTKQQAPIKKVLSEHEKKRIEEREKKEYIDYLLDTYSMLEDLENLLGPDEVRQEEMRMLRDEFHKKTEELYGTKKK